MKNKFQPNLSLAARLSGYAAAAGALVSLTAEADGQVAYSGLQNLELNLPEETTALDLDTNFVDDFNMMLYVDGESYTFGSYYYRYNFGYGVIFNAKTDSYNNSWITRIASVPIYTYYNDSSFLQVPMVDGLELGEMIESAVNSWADIDEPYWSGAMGISYYIQYFGPYGFYSSGWAAGDFRGEEKFIGVRFYIGTEQHYGWIRVSMGDLLDPLTIVDWAYEQTPGVKIRAGEGLGIELPPVPRITVPTVATNEPTQTVTVTMPEEITGFEVSDLEVINGSADNFTEVTAGLEYTIDITALAEGTVIVNIPDSTLNDLGGTPNLAASKSWSYDITPPVATFDAYWSAGPTVSVYLDFSEVVIGFEPSDLDITNGSLSYFDAYQEGLYYYFEVDLSGEDLTIGIPAGSLTDRAGNENELITQNWSFNVTPPSAILSTGFTTTSNATVQVDVLFDETIYDLYDSDFVLSNASINSLVPVSEHLHYTLTVTASAYGQVIVALPSQSVFDMDGNYNSVALVSWEYQPVGLEPSVYEEISIFPNPANDNLHIKLASEATLKLINVNGEIVYKQDHALDETIDVSSLDPGIYIIQVQDDEKVTQYKIVIE